jgi:hypothetical protein
MVCFGIGGFADSKGATMAWALLVGFGALLTCVVAATAAIFINDKEGTFFPPAPPGPRTP